MVNPHGARNSEREKTTLFKWIDLRTSVMTSSSRNLLRHSCGVDVFMQQIQHSRNSQRVVTSVLIPNSRSSGRDSSKSKKNQDIRNLSSDERKRAVSGGWKVQQAQRVTEPACL